VLYGQSVDTSTGQASMDMDISMDIHAKSVDMDMDMDGKFHIHGNPGNWTKRPIRHDVLLWYGVEQLPPNISLRPAPSPPKQSNKHHLTAAFLRYA